MRPLLRLLPLHLGGESSEREHDLLSRRIERALPIVEVVEDPYSGIEDLLDDVGRLDLLPPEPALLTHDQYLKGWMRPERVQEPRQPWSLPELGATDPIVHEDEVIPDDPAACQCIGPGMLDLPGYRPLLVGHAGLFRRLPCKDGGHERTERCQGARRRPTRPRTHVGISSGPDSLGGVNTS